MIGFIRKYLTSWFVLALFALILLAFMLTDFSSGQGGLGALGGSGERVAKIGSQSVTTTDVANRVNAEFELARQERPGLTMAEFDKQGGIDGVIDRLINSRTIIAYAEAHGMIISERLIDSEIAKTQAFFDPTGKFDRNRYLQLIGQRRLTEADHREDVKANLLADQIIAASAASAKVPSGVLTPYASLLLERRFGAASFIPTSAYMGSAPTEAEVKTYYDRNIAKYTVPETRIVRYALFDRTRFVGKVKPTEAEIEAVYKRDIAKYAANEKRVITQVIAPTQQAATSLVAKIKAGSSIQDAAKSTGLEAITLDAQDKTAFASLASAAAANAAFGASAKAIIDPQQSGLGWHVMRVESVTAIGGKSLAQVRGEIEPALTARKVEEALADMIVRIEDSIDGGATFDDVVKAEGLAVVTTPAVTASGIAPNVVGYKAPDTLPAILKDAFQSEVDDDASVVVIKPNEVDAVVKLDRILPAAAKPLADIREQVVADTAKDKASRAARKAANDVVAKVNGGALLIDALKQSGAPGAVPLSAQRLELAQAGPDASASLTTLFQLAKGKAKSIEAPDKSGYAVIWLDRLEPGDANTRPDLVQATAAELGRVVGDEYTQQLLSAMKEELKFQKNQAAINAIKKSLLSGAGAQ
jgi:peptidyl-prolyl cis-trans isomerase D